MGGAGAATSKNDTFFMSANGEQILSGKLTPA